ncbi:uncharacterized protein LOC143020375 isoform X2 [Oratosquilla oratoria]
MRYVDCNSALALLGFVLFVDLLRDIVETVTTNNAKRRRKKRWISTSDDVAIPEMLTFISDGGLQGLEDDLPVVFSDLINTRFKANITEKETNLQGNPTDCMQQQLCSANAHLAGNYGTIGAVLAMLTSNLFAQSLPQSSLENHTYSEAKEITSQHSMLLNAAKQGRLGENCTVVFPSCSSMEITGGVRYPSGENEDAVVGAPQHPTLLSSSSVLQGQGT